MTATPWRLTAAIVVVQSPNSVVAIDDEVLVDAVAQRDEARRAVVAPRDVRGAVPALRARISQTGYQVVQNQGA